jgi:predicted kinase
MGQLFIVVGNIASGKSTEAKRLSDLHNIPIVSLDGMRRMLWGGGYKFEQEYEHAIRVAESKLINEFFAEHISFIIDDSSFVSASKRKDIIRGAKFWGYKVTIIEMPKKGKEESINTRLSSNHGSYTKDVWERVWEQFDGVYDKPTKKEGAEVICLKKQKN